MASIFGHVLASATIGKGFSLKKNIKFWILAAVCSFIPDADVISFSFGIPYGSFWGHRGFTHSFVFALLFGALITLVFYYKIAFTKKGIVYFLFFSLATASHSILDAMTNGGLGVAFFSPFDNTRYFFPFRPIQVSPIGAGKFFSLWGLRVLLSELVWIGIPSIVILVIFKIRKIFFVSNKK